jgi:hypothetical protein
MWSPDSAQLPELEVRHSKTRCSSRLAVARALERQARRRIGWPADLFEAISLKN